MSTTKDFSISQFHIDSTSAFNHSISELDLEETSNFKSNFLLFIWKFLGGVVILLASIFTCTGFHRYKRRRCSSTKFMTSLAVVSLMVGVFMPIESLFWIPGPMTAWQNSKPLCILRLCGTMTFHVSSLLHVMAISIDRFMLVAYPFCYHRTYAGLCVNILIGAMWVFAILIGTVPAYAFSFKGMTQCDPAQLLPRSYYVYFATFLMLFAFIVSAALFCKMAKLACASQRLVNPHSDQCYQCSADFRRRLRTVRMSFLVFVVMVVFFTPHYVANIVLQFTPVSLDARAICTSLAFFNSVGTLLGYLVENEEFRMNIEIQCKCRDPEDLDLLASPSVISTTLSQIQTSTISSDIDDDY